ncbi:uncharacterized protein CBL_08090 [Carabus blaptoides fortunei]
MDIRLCIVVLLVGLTLISGQSILMSSYLERQLQCALDKAPCDYYGYQIKRSLPFILNNECRACDPRKMSNAQLLAKFIEMRYPDIWMELLQKYGFKNKRINTNATYK